MVIGKINFARIRMGSVLATALVLGACGWPGLIAGALSTPTSVDDASSNVTVADGLLFALDYRHYWQLWIAPYSSVRTLPGFKAMLRDTGLVDFWRKTGD